MILVNKTYEVITEESAENGDFQETGFSFEDEKFSFLDLLCELKEWNFEGTDPINHGDQSWKDGSFTNEALHFSHSNLARSRKYWDKAIQKTLLDRKKKYETPH